MQEIANLPTTYRIDMDGPNLVEGGIPEPGGWHRCYAEVGYYNLECQLEATSCPDGETYHCRVVVLPDTILGLEGFTLAFKRIV